MKNARFLFTAVLLTIFISNTFADLGTNCNDGDTRKDDDNCNDCFCMNGNWACTLKLCTDVHIQAKREASECQPGETKKIQCNNCKCIQGYWACSRKACLSKRDTNECDEGETKQEACNSCFCTNGLWVCTKKRCLKKKRDVPTKVLADLKNVPCSPSDTFFFDCNRCQCNYERTGYTCVKAQNCTLTT